MQTGDGRDIGSRRGWVSLMQGDRQFQSKSITESFDRDLRKRQGGPDLVQTIRNDTCGIASSLHSERQAHAQSGSALRSDPQFGQILQVVRHRFHSADLSMELLVAVRPIDRSDT